MERLKKHLFLRVFNAVCFALVLCFTCMIHAHAEDEIDYPFTLTTTELAAGDRFVFKISAAGTFYVDCDNGEPVMEINRPDTIQSTYTCSYTTGGVKTIKFGGRATGYCGGWNTNCVNGGNYSSNGTDVWTVVSSIRFGSHNIKKLDGNLSAIFPSLGSADNQQPNFSQTFDGQYLLTEISENLFANITIGKPAMFSDTFVNCISLPEIPSNLFANITNTEDGFYMFMGTFARTGITSIPENLFTGITTGADLMFLGTFTGCPRLTAIPENLFSHITTAGLGAFGYTFLGTGITEIPSGLFSNIRSFNISSWESFAQEMGISSSYDVTGGELMFMGTFANCTRLTNIPDNLFANFTTGAAGMFSGTFDITPQYANRNEFIQQMQMMSPDFDTEIWADLLIGLNHSYHDLEACFELEDYLAAGYDELTEEDRYYIDYYYIYLCSLYYETPRLITIPANLFANITNAAPGMFAGTFWGRENLTGYVPKTLFAGLIENGSPYASDMMTYIFKDTGLAESCEPYDTEQFETGYEEYWNGKVSCESTEPICNSGKYLHIGEDKMCLSETKSDGVPAMAFGKTDGSKGKYYLNMTARPSGAKGLSISKDSNKIFNILYRGNVYNLHDDSVSAGSN